jgi:hypothetical protein
MAEGYMRWKAEGRGFKVKPQRFDFTLTEESLMAEGRKVEGLKTVN